MFNFEEERISERHHRLYWLSTRALGISLPILIFHLIILIWGDDLPKSPIPPDIHILATSTFASTLLTFALLAVYADIGRTQSEQKEILRNQEQLMESSHEPAVDILDVKGDNEEKIYLELENMGNGPVHSLSGTVHVAPVKPGSGDYTMPKFPNRKGTYSEMTKVDSDSRALEPRESGQFEFDVWMPDFDTKNKGQAWNQGIEDLVDAGIEQVDLQLSIRFEHLIPTKGAGYLHRGIRRGDLTENDRFGDLWETSSSWVAAAPDAYENDVPFEEDGVHYEDN